MRVILLSPLLLLTVLAAPPSVITDHTLEPRELFGLEKLQSALASISAAPTVSIERQASLPVEGFRISRQANDLRIQASDASGTLYACIELASRIRGANALPAALDITDAPQFVLRGTNVGMQKTALTYDGASYDYRYTPEEFPFFYDKQLWTKYLDFLAEGRMNSLYLWNGHPFTSLLKLPQYPDAQELTNEQLDRNIAMFRWLTTEADRRGIWVIQMFYNIHISHALARSRGIAFHHSTPTPLVSAYTRYCISEFISQYPNAGLMMTLGEALAPQHGPAWLAETVIPGVRDGMKALGTTREPPIIVRAHATRIEEAMARALPLYRNIYTMHKWNGESLTWTDVRGDVLELHRKLVGLGSTHISNVHLLANLEPFRWGATEFIQKTMQSSQRIGIKGLHVYPLRYWDWPVSADNPPILQIERDWIWFEAWARYAWNPIRETAVGRKYCTDRHAFKYRTAGAAANISTAYQLAGVAQPRLLPRIGITEGNRQSFTLGMLMTQLINPVRYNEFPLLWTGDAPPGERLKDYVAREWNHQSHEGETPLGVADEVVESTRRAVAALDAAAPRVTLNRDEFARLANDVRAVHRQMLYYQAKTRAAALVLRYGYSRDLDDLRKALPLLQDSLDHYRQLLALTDAAYREACSIHSHFRRVPFLGAPGRYTHWRDCIPAYERELANFQRNLKLLETSGATAAQQEPAPLPFVVAKSSAEGFIVEPGARIYTDRPLTIRNVASELKGMRGLRVANETAAKSGVVLDFEIPESAQILVGFFRSEKRNAAAAPPRDEWEPILRNAVEIEGHPALTVYAHSLPPGRSNLDFGPGAYVVLGFVKGTAQPVPRMVFFGPRPDLDWLFE